MGRDGHVPAHVFVQVPEVEVARVHTPVRFLDIVAVVRDAWGF